MYETSTCTRVIVALSGCLLFAYSQQNGATNLHNLKRLVAQRCQFTWQRPTLDCAAISVPQNVCKLCETKPKLIKLAWSTGNSLRISHARESNNQTWSHTQIDGVLDTSQKRDQHTLRYKNKHDSHGTGKLVDCFLYVHISVN